MTPRLPSRGQLPLIAWLPRACTVGVMSNNIYVQLPGWVTRHHTIDLGGHPRWRRHQAALLPRANIVPRPRLHVHVESDRCEGRAQVLLPRRRRRLRTPPLHGVRLPILAHRSESVACCRWGTLRNEYEPDPELTIKPTRSRLNLDEDEDNDWLRRRSRRLALGHLDAISRLD